MADRGQITGGIVDGPLAFDNAVSEEAAKIKSIASPVAGRADILIVPDLGVRQDGLRAQLRMQSFVTGVLYVALDLRPDTPIVLRKLDPRVPELPAIPTDIEVWTAKLERFAATIEKVPLEQIAHTASVVLDDVRKILESKDTQDLFRNANGALSEARTLVHRVGGKIDPLVAQLNGTLARVDAGLDAVRKLALDVDTRIDPLANQAEATLKTAQVTVADVQPLIEDLRHLALATMKRRRHLQA